MHFPEEGLVFDYRLEDAGISTANDDEDEEEEGKQVTAGLHQGDKTKRGPTKWRLSSLMNNDV